MAAPILIGSRRSPPSRTLTPLLTLSWMLLLTLPVRAAGPCEADGLPPPYAALGTARVALEAGAPAKALAALEGTDELPEGPARRTRDLLRGRALLEAGELARGRDALLGVLAGAAGEAAYRPTACDADPGEARWWLAQGAVRRGEPDKAIPTWQRIWTDNPRSPRVADAVARLASVGQAVPDATSAAGRALVEARVATLGTLQDHAEALQLLLLLPPDGSDAGRRRLARAHFSARDYKEAVRLLGTLATPDAQDLFDRGLAMSRTGDYSSAAAIYRALIAAHPDAPQAQEASFKLGYLAWDGGQPEAALEHFEAYRRDFPDGRHDDEALWFQGWTLLQLGRVDEARKLLRQLAGKGSSLAPGGAYWAARLAGNEESEQLRAVVAEHPDTIYAWWAARALHQRWDAPPPVAAPDPATLRSSLAPEQSASLGRGLDLAQAGLGDWAAAELGPLIAMVRGDRERSLALAQALADAGAWPDSRRVAQPFCGAASERVDLVALKLCWPRPGGDPVAQAAAAAGLPPHLPFAIMRNESGFDPRIVSSAGARGLMQLMPALVSVPPDALFDPAINTAEGVAELGKLRASLADTGVSPLEPLVIAAYNGGEDAVRRWLADEPAPVDVDRWAEEISFSETRRYVRRVLGTLQVYRYVYGDR